MSTVSQQPTLKGEPMHTLTTILNRANITTPDPTLADLEVPVLTGPQRQGDILIIPRPAAGKAELADMRPVPAKGVAVVIGEATGNTHLLQPEPGTEIHWTTTNRTTGVNLGTIHIPTGGCGWLIHTDEHGANGIGPGTYTVHGKREQAEELRRVAD